MNMYCFSAILHMFYTMHCYMFMSALRAYKTKGYVCTFRETIIERLTNNWVKGEETLDQTGSFFCTASTINEQSVVLYT